MFYHYRFYLSNSCRRPTWDSVGSVPGGRHGSRPNEFGLGDRHREVDDFLGECGWCYFMSLYWRMVTRRCLRNLMSLRMPKVHQLYLEYNRRKFRSLTSDNMDSWKSSAARKKINRCGKKEDQQARNVREVAKCCVFQCFVCRLGRKVTSLKRRVRR